LTKFFDDVAPYLWNVDLLLSASVKNDQGSLNLVQQSHVLRLDAPDLFDHLMRLDARGSFDRTINQGYYGLGNASSAGPRSGDTATGRLNQFIHEEARIRNILRVHTGTPVDLAFGTNFRYEWPEVYAGSKLATDAATQNPDGSPYVRGTQAGALAGLTAGVIVDTRDSEFITTRGFYYQLGVGATVGSAESIGYGTAGAVLANYAPLFGPFIFASRFVVDFQFGNVPFYDQQQGGPYETQYLLGSETGVRGVPQGRYAGPIKVITNLEIRAPGPRFRLFGQRLRIGAAGFFDAGRLWGGYDTNIARDGGKLGLKYGIGAGTFLQWGEAAIFRVEAAYSPDAESENPGFPVGIYVSDGLMF
jgi:outer membrane protein assembly factor BamA